MITDWAGLGWEDSLPGCSILSDLSHRPILTMILGVSSAMGFNENGVTDIKPTSILPYAKLVVRFVWLLECYFVTSCCAPRSGIPDRLLSH